jgi:hypothetical protein
MAFDRNRPVQWKRLLIEWGVVCLAVGVMMLFFDSLRSPGNVAGLAFGGAVYLGFGWLMAKLGYQRQRVRWDQARAAGAPTATTSPPRSATRPAPTKRTNGPKGKK